MPTICQVTLTEPMTAITFWSSPQNRLGVSPPRSRGAARPLHGFIHRLKALTERPLYVLAASRNLPTRLGDVPPGDQTLRPKGKIRMTSVPSPAAREVRT